MMNKFYNQAIKQAIDHQLTDPIQLSISLIVTSLKPAKYRFEHEVIYQQYHDRLNSIHETNGTTTELAWLTGRLYYSNYLVNQRNISNVPLIKQVAQDLNKLDFPKDHFTLWAHGYFALDKHMYNQYIKLAPIFLEAVTNQSEKIWGEVMHLRACSEQQDKEEFDIVKERLLGLTSSKKLVDAVGILPLTSHRLWGYCTVAEALLKLDKKQNMNEIMELLHNTEKFMKESGNLNDVALASAFEDRLKEKYGITDISFNK